MSSAGKLRVSSEALQNLQCGVGLRPARPSVQLLEARGAWQLEGGLAEPASVMGRGTEEAHTAEAEVGEG